MTLVTHEEAPIRLGDAAKDDDEVQQQEIRKIVVQNYEAENLCSTCFHAPICAVVTTIRAMNAEGEITISKCSAHLPISSPDQAPDSPSE